MSPKTILSSAPPGARTLDTLIKRKGFQSLFYCIFCFFLAVYAVISLCYNEHAVDSFQQEGGERLGVISLFYYLRHSKCSRLLHMQMAGR